MVCFFSVYCLIMVDICTYRFYVNTMILTLKAPIKAADDDIHKYFFIIL